jgi:hypothetical protein
MKKDSLICFRVSKDLHESLSQIAKKDRRSLSSAIEMVLSNYVKEKNQFHGVEKRTYPRKLLSVPTVINQEDLRKMSMGTINDISLGGVKIFISNEFKDRISIDSQASRFDLVFNLPGVTLPIELACESSRLDDCEDGVYIGASFVDADFNGYKALQSFLM